MSGIIETFSSRVRDQAMPMGQAPQDKVRDDDLEACGHSGKASFDRCRIPMAERCARHAEARRPSDDCTGSASTRCLDTIPAHACAWRPRVVSSNPSSPKSVPVAQWKASPGDRVAGVHEKCRKKAAQAARHRPALEARRNQGVPRRGALRQEPRGLMMDLSRARKRMRAFPGPGVGGSSWIERRSMRPHLR